MAKRGIISGLDSLAGINQVIITQDLESVEGNSKYEMKSTYSVLDRNKVKLFAVTEETNCCLRQFCGSDRPFVMSFSDVRTGVEVMQVERLYRGCCFSLNLQNLHVLNPSGLCIGRVRQDCSLLRPTFSLLDDNKDTLLSVKGPFKSCRWCDITFEIYDTGSTVGYIRKHLSGSADDFMSEDGLSVEFSAVLDERAKAMIIAASFLIGSMYYGL